MLYLKRLKILLLFSIPLIRIPFILDIKSEYKDETTIQGIINNYKIDGNKLTLEIIGKEKIIGNYYFKTKEEKKLYQNTIQLGNKVILKGELVKPKNNSNFNLFNYRKYLLSKKIYWTFNVDEIKQTTNTKIRYKIKNTIIDRINNSKNATYLKLFILGENDLDLDVKKSFQINGVSHLFAISGMHVTLLTTCLLLLLNKISKNKKINFILITIILLFYMFLTNYSPSVVRASLLFILLNIKKILNFNISNLELIILLLLLFLNYNPYYIYNNGFLYSFSISIGLIIYSNTINKYDNYFKKVFITSLISFLISIPIGINSFNQINLLSPLFNILFVPFVSFIAFPLSLLNFCFLQFDFIYSLVIQILEYISLICSKITIFNLTLCSIPIYLIILYCLFIIWVMNKFCVKRIIILLFILLIHTNINYLNRHPIITMIDVGQGDSILIELPHNKTNILIDTGGIITYNNEKWQKKKNNYSLATNTIIPYLKSKGIKKLDYLILTHGDYDHMGEAINLVNNFKVNRVIFNNDNYNDLEQNLIKVLDKKKIKYYKNVNMNKYNLYSLNTGLYDNENDNSNVLYFEYNNFKFLFMGDAGINKEKDILNKYNIKDIDFLKIGHHGSDTSSSKEFIDKIKPKNCFISVGSNNKYGHPKNSVLDALDDCNIYRTDINGSIEIRLNNNRYKIKAINP